VFQSTPPREGVTEQQQGQYNRKYVSIHTPP
jgi:hypothetical protein